MKKYIQDIKRSINLFRRTGTELFLFVLGFSLLRDAAVIPLLGKLWSLVLSTTPEGFISNANAKEALLKSPWIIPAGIILLAAYAFLALWQTSAIITGIGYATEGHRIRLRDLFVISGKKTLQGFYPRNLMFPVYALILLPLTNLFSTNDLFVSMMVPEYIFDFILAKPALSILFFLLILTALYFVLRWLYVLPSFLLKGKSFKEAKLESNGLTQKGWFVNGLRVIGYSLVEYVRLTILPLLVIGLPVLIAYICTHEVKYSLNIFTRIGKNQGWLFVETIASAFIQISVLCFLVTEYMIKLEKKEAETSLVLSDLHDKERKKDRPIWVAQLIASLLASVFITLGYLGVVLIVHKDQSKILDIFDRTDIIAHKGYSSKAPENTMPAFELADKSTATDYIELDVWSSKDGIPVVIHNETIKDATGIDKYIYDCTYEELQTYPAPYFMDAETFKDARIPSLEEVLAAYADTTPILIEIKGFKQDPELSAKIVKLMEKYYCTSTSLVHSGDYNALKAVKQLNPDIQCGLIMAMVTGNYYDIPYVDFFSLEHNFVSEKLIDKLHQHGKQVFAWTVNYDDSATELMMSGVDAIITDYPDDIQGYVANENEAVDEVVMNILNDRLTRIDEKTGLTLYQKGEY